MRSSISAPSNSNTEKLGEATGGFALRHAPDGSGEADYVAAALVCCKIAPNPSTRAMQSDAQAAAGLASQTADLKLRPTRSATRQQAREQLGQARQRGSVDCVEVDAPRGRSGGVV
jgi:hypothetical protein